MYTPLVERAAHQRAALDSPQQREERVPPPIELARERLVRVRQSADDDGLGRVELLQARLMDSF